jgi:hypothetical protein
MYYIRKVSPFVGTEGLDLSRTSGLGLSRTSGLEDLKEDPSPTDPKETPLEIRPIGEDETEEVEVEPPKIEEPENELDLLDHDAWIMVVANTTSITIPYSTKSEAVTKYIYTKYPHANLYSSSSREGAYQTGDIVISRGEKTIVSLLAEYGSGAPKKSTDTKEARLKWFSKSLSKLSNVLPSPPPTLAIASDTLLPSYEDELRKFAAESGVGIKLLTLTEAKKKGRRIKSKMGVPLRGPSAPTTLVHPSKVAVVNEVETVNEVEVETVDEINDVNEVDEASSLPENFDEDPVVRGIFYASTFSPLNLSSQKYSKAVKTIESYSAEDRKTWLEIFLLDEENQNNLIKDLL